MAARAWTLERDPLGVWGDDGGGVCGGADLSNGFFGSTGFFFETVGFDNAGDGGCGGAVLIACWLPSLILQLIVSLADGEVVFSSSSSVCTAQVT